MRIKGALVAFLLMFAGAGTCIAATFTLDRNNTVVRFTYQVGFVSQSAHFGELSGAFKFDEAREVQQQIATIETNIKELE